MLASDVVDALVAAVGILAGAIAIGSGIRALYAILPPRLPAGVLGEGVNRGLAWGFLIGTPLASAVFVIVLDKGFGT